MTSGESGLSSQEGIGEILKFNPHTDFLRLNKIIYLNKLMGNKSKS